jgi:hypothetical protein
MEPGIDIDGPAKNEVNHFMRCPGCGQWFDMRELGRRWRVNGPGSE